MRSLFTCVVLVAALSRAEHSIEITSPTDGALLVGPEVGGKKSI